MILATLLIAKLRRNILKVYKEPFVLFCLLFYILFVVGCFWSNASYVSMLRMLIKVAGLFELPFLIVFFVPYNNRKFALYGFGIGNIITLFFSYFSILANFPIFHAKDWGIHYGIFRAHTYHCYFLAIFAGYLLFSLLNNKIIKNWQKYFSIFLIALSLHNIFFETYSRTGQILTIIIFIAILLQWHFKYGIIVSLIVIFGIVPAVIITSPVVQYKIKTYQENVVEFQTGKFDQQNPSMFLRWTFHKYAEMLIAQKPILGFGTGSYNIEYSKISKKYNNPFSNTQPHDDYLWFGVELGLTGIFMLGIFFIFLFIRSLNLARPYREFSLSITITYAIACLENGFLTDTVSGLAFFLMVAICFSSKYSSNTKLSKLYLK